MYVLSSVPEIFLFWRDYGASAGFDEWHSDPVPPAAAPEPSFLLFFGTALLGLRGFKKKMI